MQSANVIGVAIERIQALRQQLSLPLTLVDKALSAAAAVRTHTIMSAPKNRSARTRTLTASSSFLC
jgi:hypothetical protein